MHYSIGEVAGATGICISTLRYYDREGLFPDMRRSEGGVRIFSDKEIRAIQVIKCLKISGMSIKDVKKFLDWCQEGDSSLEKRRNMFEERLEAIQKQFDEIQETMAVIKYKHWYYNMACAEGSEDAVKNMPPENMPEEIQAYICSL